MKEYKIQGKFDHEKDVLVEIKKTVPQPDLIVKTTLSVGDIDHRLEEIEKEIIKLQEEKTDLEQTLEEIAPQVQEALNDKTP